jgi:hypothetical protein
MSLRSLCVFSLLLCGCCSRALAQTTGGGYIVPTVTVLATDPIASAAGSPGVFTFFRKGSTNLALNVWYELSGTASNGVDYVWIPPHLVQIAAGATSATIIITPQTNTQSGVVSKTVVLQLTNSPMLNPVNYEIGSPSTAVVFLKAPVGIISPKEGTVFYTPTNIQVVAFIDAVSFGYLNDLTNVEFFAGTNDLGKGILNLGKVGGFCGLTWTNPPAGNYALTAVAYYTDLAAVKSAPVNIIVRPVSPTNLPPEIRIVSPQNGATLCTPTNIQLLAKARDLDGSITKVEFFAGDIDLGEGFPVVLDPPGVNGVVGLVYFLTWNDPAPGKYSLTVVATDNDGAATTSDPVNILVRPGPPTNHPPVVRITSPPNGSVFRSPIDLPIFAYASDADGAVTSVEFFADSTSLGFGRRVTVVPPPLPPGPVQPPILNFRPTNYWELTWSNAPVGGHALTAVATDDAGLTTRSLPVKTTILPPIIPPTNRPPIVSIVATDPVAVEGTNSWIWEGETNETPTWAVWPTAVCHPFTNCGPKTATFVVRRFGDLSGDLTVNYAIGGSASNGVDYVLLPGLVTIPAGKVAAMITIIPIDDGPPDVNKTVVLTLLPDMRMSPLPGYVLGFPRRAAAIILDCDGPRPSTAMLPCGCFHLVKPGPDAAWFCVEYSTNLTNWTPVCTNQVVNGSIDFVDPDAAGSPGRFYRVLPVVNAP